MTWFTKLMGFDEESPDQVQSQSKAEDGQLISLVNDQHYQIGEFHLLSLAKIRAQSDDLLQTGDQPSQCLNASAMFKPSITK